MSVFTEREDLSVVLDTIKQETFCDSSNLYLLGESQGGMVSAMLVSERVSEPKGLILLYPAFIIPDDARKLFFRIEDVPETVDIMGIKIGRKYYEGILDMNVWDEIAGLTKDVLLIHGTQDVIVPIDYARKAATVYFSCSLIELDGAKHGFEFLGSYLEQAVECTINFIQKKF